MRKDFAWDPAWVGTVTAPTLLLWTEHDPTGGLDEAAMLLDWLPDARLHVIADAGHWPFATMLPPAAVARLGPDAVVVIGPDHFHANFYDVMPPFVLGVEEAEGFGDFGSRSGPLPVATGLAWPIRDGLAAAGFDVALSYALTVDHGVVQSYDLICGTDAGGGAGIGAGAGLPLVPLVVNTAAPPLPSMERCAALGRALGATIRDAAFGGRVLLIASGGLSHWLPSSDPRDASVAAERRASVIHGRTSTPSGTAGSSSSCPTVTWPRSPNWATPGWKTTQAEAGTRSAPGWWGRPRPALRWCGPKALEMLAGARASRPGTGASILGHPLAAVAWLAAAVRDHGSPLRAGEVVLSGSLGPMVSVAPGDAFQADISGIGQVSAVFAGGTS